MEIATAGQGVFSRNLPANFHTVATRIRENREAHAAHPSASSRAGNRRRGYSGFRTTVAEGRTGL
jgi:hypothetical protein